MSKRFPTSYPVRLLTWVVFFIFVRFFRIKRVMPNEVKRLKSPYLLLSNHVGYWDPFLVGHLLPRFTHFVASDMAFSRPIPAFFLPRLGVIPKRKNIRDIQVIRDISEVIAQRENVGIFPEAVRNWSGTTQPIDPSIAKLIRLLKVPVVIAVMRGMNLFNPRWSKKLRRTHVEVEYSLLLSGTEARELSVEEIFEKVKDAMSYDEVDHQRTHLHMLRSNHRAEWISHALFVCPSCQAIDSFVCHRNDFECSDCNYSIQIDSYGFFQLLAGEKLFFDNIRDWFDWQERWLLEFVTQKVHEQQKQYLFEDINSEVLRCGKNLKFQSLGQADIRLYIDRIEIRFSNEAHFLNLSFNDIQTLNPQVNENVELIMGDQMYRFVGGRPGVSGLKWELAANAIWKQLGHVQKLSPYIGMRDK
jgi:1-acyl-sn-glycerol-3-phosphate acyltransferase